MMIKYIIGILLVLGFLNALYVNYLYWIDIPSNIHINRLCDFNQTYSCTVALLSDTTKIFGIPGCTYALFVYPLLFVFLIYTKNCPILWRWIMGLGWMGCVMNIYILAREYQEGVYCLLCIGCGIIITMVAILATTIVIKKISL